MNASALARFCPIKSDVAKTKLSKKEGTFSGHYVLLLVKKERLDNLVNEKQFDSGIP